MLNHFYNSSDVCLPTYYGQTLFFQFFSHLFLQALKLKLPSVIQRYTTCLVLVPIICKDAIIYCGPLGGELQLKLLLA